MKEAFEEFLKYFRGAPAGLKIELVHSLTDDALQMAKQKAETAEKDFLSLKADYQNLRDALQPTAAAVKEEPSLSDHKTQRGW